jgi:hypothetical protein
MVPVWAPTPRTVSCPYPAHSRPACLLGKRLAAPKVLFIQIHYGGIKTSVLHIQPKSFALPTQNQAQPLFFLRLSFSTALSERLSCSLNLIEPHLGPDLRSTLSVDLGCVPELILERSVYDPRNPNDAPSCDSGICRNPRNYSASSSGTSTNRNTHGEISTPKPAEHHDLTLGSKEVQHLKSRLGFTKNFAAANTFATSRYAHSPRKPLGHLPSPEDGPSP